jgi:LAGLIDADG DNA endonuclease family
MQLTQRCEQVVVGTILGDGCLERNGSNVRLRIDHGVAQRALVEWKFHELKELSPSLPRLVRRIDVRTGRIHSNYRFTTATVEALNRYFLQFYGGRLKFVPDCIHQLLHSPLSLAVWYMDDGGRRRDCRSGYLNTNAFSASEVAVLRQCLQNNYGIRSATHFAAGKPRIYIPKAHFGAFCDVIRPHVIQEMSYKLL